MNAQVVTCYIETSATRGKPYYHPDMFFASLRRFAETPTNVGEGADWRGLMSKPFLLRNWLRAGKNTSDRIIVTDALDIVFVKHPHGIGDECERLFGDAVVFNAEKGCWPRADLEAAFPDTGSAWRFLNSGFMCGPADRILEILEIMDIEKIGFDPPGGPYPNDQGEYQQIFANQSLKPGEEIVYAGRYPYPTLRIDTECEIAQCCSSCVIEDFDLSGPMVVNRKTGSCPGVWHFNGGSKNELMPAMLEKWGLP